jgi:hypothetical protein
MTSRSSWDIHFSSYPVLRMAATAAFVLAAPLRNTREQCECERECEYEGACQRHAEYTHS